MGAAVVAVYLAMTRAPRLGGFRVQVVSVPAPVVNLPPPAPPPAVVVNVEQPPPLEPPEPPPVPPPQATMPTINRGCLLSSGVGSSCGWDDGFPAVSADGRRIAMMNMEVDEDYDPSGRMVRIIDARSQRTVMELPLVTRADQEILDSLVDAAGLAAWERARKRVTQRAARAQRVLDAAGYRTLRLLGRSDALDASGDARLDRTVHVEIDEGLVRAIDRETNQVLWQREFLKAAPHRIDPDADCGDWSLAETEVWWDAETHVVFVNQSYHAGGCMCGEDGVTHVWQAPAPRAHR